MYLFGGRDDKGPKNKLYILKVGIKPTEWVSADVAGTPPMPRYGHSMNYYPEKSILIIFGGRNDENFANSGESNLNDVWILYLEKLTWVEWNLKDYTGVRPVPRYSHCAENLGTSILILGGLSEDNYCRTDVYSLDVEVNRHQTTKCSEEIIILQKASKAKVGAGGGEIENIKKK